MILTMLAVLSQPASKSRPVHHVSIGKAGRTDKTENSMRGHQTPLLLRTVDHPVDEVTVTDAGCCIVG